MKQVNVWITDEAHEILVEEAARRQLVSKKVVKIAALASELLTPAIYHVLNDNKPDMPAPDASIKEDKIDNKKVSKSSFDFSALDI
jgi:transcriptional regulator of met regulon